MVGKLTVGLPVSSAPELGDMCSAGHWVSTATAALATLALIIFAGVYTRVSKPVNTALTAAAIADRVPDDARELQARWDSVIDLRVALQTLALAAPCVGLAAA